MTESQRSAETKQKLLETASEVFAEKGFRNARVREICQRADGVLSKNSIAAQKWAASAQNGGRSRFA